jgi:hypothetical protein
LVGNNVCAPDHVLEVSIAVGHDICCRIADLHTASVVKSSRVPTDSTTSKALVLKSANISKVHANTSSVCFPYFNQHLHDASGTDQDLKALTIKKQQQNTSPQ